MTYMRGVRTARQTCAGCPDQWEGWLVDGRSFYFRLRHGIARLDVRPANDAFHRSVHSGELNLGYTGDGPEMQAPISDGIWETDEERDDVFSALLAQVNGGE